MNGVAILVPPASLGRRFSRWCARLRGHGHGGPGRYHGPPPVPPVGSGEAPRPGSGVPLSEQEPGFRGTVVRVRGQEAIRRRLMEMGVTAGTEIEFEREAPLGDPLQVKVRGYHLSLRRTEARHVYVTG